MKNKDALYILLTCLAFFIAGTYTCRAQCSTRYIDSTFTQIDTTFNVVYTTTAGGGSQTLLLDVYQPHNDTATNRKLIVWAHGGAFFQGTKNDNDMQFLCTNFANRGYVCASINYRLAPSIINLYDSIAAFGYIMKAVNDMKAAIRFFRKDAASGNTYRIDTNAIFGGGGSAGAIMIDFASTIDSVGETPSYFQTVMDNNGGIEGNSGNDGYSSKVVAVASLAGGISDLGWISPGNPPMFFAQGTADPIIPYECADVFTGYTGGTVPLFRLCGSSEMEPQVAALGVPTALEPFEGAGHVPWNSDQHMMNEVDSALAVFFYTLSCQLPNAVTNITAGSGQVQVYPNPASGNLHVAVNDDRELMQLTLFDYTGRQVYTQAAAGHLCDILMPHLANGMYTLKIQFKAPGLAPVTQKVEVE